MGTYRDEIIADVPDIGLTRTGYIKSSELTNLPCKARDAVMDEVFKEANERLSKLLKENNDEIGSFKAVKYLQVFVRNAGLPSNDYWGSFFKTSESLHDQTYEMHVRLYDIAISFLTERTSTCEGAWAEASESKNRVQSMLKHSGFVDYNVGDLTAHNWVVLDDNMSTVHNFIATVDSGSVDLDKVWHELLAKQLSRPRLGRMQAINNAVDDFWKAVRGKKYKRTI